MRRAVEPWTSTFIPDWTRASDGTTTPGGLQAVFRSSMHAWIALRLVYLGAVAERPPHEVAERATRYQHAYQLYEQHGRNMQAVVVNLDDLPTAAALWNSIDQVAVNDAYTTLICEREPFPKNNLATVALAHFGLGPPASAEADGRDRKSNAKDNEAAWQDSPGGLCRSCGTPTISQNQHDRLRTLLAAHQDLFDTSPTYRQKSGAEAPLWSERILNAAKGVADHIVAWSALGRTTNDNLANVCPGCNYSRNNSDLDTVRVAAFTRTA